MTIDSVEAYCMLMQNERFKVFESQDPENGFFDVTFEIEGKILYANKCILAPISTTFKSMFSDRWLAKNEIVKIETYKYDDFKELLTFIYSGKCNITKENIFTMVDLAEFYNVFALHQKCDYWLSKIEFTAEKIFKYFNALSKYGDSYHQFQQAIEAAAKKTYSDLLDFDDFQGVSKDALNFIVSLDRPNALEQKLLEFVFKWAEHEVFIKQSLTPSENNEFHEAMKNEFFEIVPKIHFNAMEEKFVKTFVVERGYIFSSFKFLNEILCNIKKFKVEVTDINGKKMTGILYDQNYIVDEIKKIENGATSNITGCYWSFRKDFPIAYSKHFSNGTNANYYLQIGKDNNLWIYPRLDTDYFLAELSCESGFILGSCKIQIK